jgi:hypothetical protein
LHPEPTRTTKSAFIVFEFSSFRLFSKFHRRQMSVIFLGVALLLVEGMAGTEKRISIYSPVADYSLNVIDRDGREYVGLLEVLEPIGSVSAKVDRENWKLRFNSIEAQFTNGNAHARVRSKDVDLSARFILDNGRGLVPIDSLVSYCRNLLGFQLCFM